MICFECMGNRVVPIKRELEVHVQKGMKDLDKIVLQGQADEFVGFQVLYLSPYSQTFRFYFYLSNSEVDKENPSYKSLDYLKDPTSNI